MDGSIYRDMVIAKLQGKPLRIYFRCQRGGNEKALWLKAFSRIDRLSYLYRRKRSFLRTLKSPVHLTHSRMRSASSIAFAKGVKQLDPEPDETSSSDVNIHLMHSSKADAQTSHHEKEHRVLPLHAYPNIWMTKREIMDELVRTSEHFHDLSNHHTEQTKMVGRFHLEILAAHGLPKLDRYSETGKSKFGPPDSLSVSLFRLLNNQYMCRCRCICCLWTIRFLYRCHKKPRKSYVASKGTKSLHFTASSCLCSCLCWSFR